MSVSILDIETLAQSTEQILANLPEWSEEEALTRKGNRTKPETISAFLEEDKANHGKDAIEKAALTPEHARIAIVGFWKEGRVEQLVADKDLHVPSGEGQVVSMLDESELIEHAFMRLGEWNSRWTTADSEGNLIPPDRSNPILGWNLHGMEIPMLVRRAWILGVKVPKTIFNPLSRYPVPDRFVDMMKVWSAGNYKATYFKLNNALKAASLPEKGDGKEFGKLWQESRGAALAYSANELDLQSQLYRRMGVDL